MLPRLLLDTHVVIRWLVNARKLSREQIRTIEAAARHREPVGISAVSVLEIAGLTGSGRLSRPLQQIWTALQEDPLFKLIPITFDIGTEIAALRDSLRDPADRAIVATARVHGLRLVTSDERIIDSRLVPVVE